MNAPRYGVPICLAPAPAPAPAGDGDEYRVNPILHLSIDCPSTGGRSAIVIFAAIPEFRQGNLNMEMRWHADVFVPTCRISGGRYPMVKFCLAASPIEFINVSCVLCSRGATGQRGIYRRSERSLFILLLVPLVKIAASFTFYCCFAVA